MKKLELTPEDILNQEFKVDFKGYDMNEVDSFLDKALNDYQVMEENVYSILPEYQVNSLRDVMLEDEINASYKKFLKKSDNLAAFIECWREIDAGSKHYYYIEVLQRDFECKENLPEAFRLLVEKLYGSVIYH